MRIQGTWITRHRWWAAEYGCTETVKLLLATGDVELNSQHTGYFMAEMTALAAAAGRGNVGVIKMLLSRRGIDVNMYDAEGYTPLSHAALHMKTEAVRLLLTQPNINLEQRNESGETALMQAAMSGAADVIELLLEKDADVNAKDNCGHTALYYASNCKHGKAVEALLRSRKASEVDLLEESCWERLSFSLEAELPGKGTAQKKIWAA